MFQTWPFATFSRTLSPLFSALPFALFCGLAFPKDPAVPKILESVSTGVWCVLGFGAGFEIALEPSKLKKEGDKPGKRHLHFLCQTLVCSRAWFKRDLKILCRSDFTNVLRVVNLLSHSDLLSRPPCALRSLPNANAKSQRFSYAISQIAPLPPVVALNRSFKSQIAARYAAFWHAVSQIALTSFL